MDRSGFIIIAFLSLLIMGNWCCYEHPEGCMDVFAENYEVEADKPCEDCCKYPSLLLSVSHMLGDTLIDTNYVWNSGEQEFRIRSLNFYLSGFLFGEGLRYDSVTIQERIEILPDGMDAEEYISSTFPVVKINLGRTGDYNLGTFRYADLYQKINFDFGLKDQVNHANMDRIPTSNALYQNQDSMYINQSEGFYFLKMDIEYIGETEKNIRISGDVNKISYTFESNFDFREREDRVLEMKIDYEQWFNNVDFEEDSENEIAQKLMNDLGKALIFEN